MNVEAFSLFSGKVREVKLMCICENQTFFIDAFRLFHLMS